MTEQQILEVYPAALAKARNFYPSHTLISWYFDSYFKQYLFLFEYAGTKRQCHVGKFGLTTRDWVAQYSSGIDDVDWKEPL